MHLNHIHLRKNKKVKVNKNLSIKVKLEKNLSKRNNQDPCKISEFSKKNPCIFRKAKRLMTCQVNSRIIDSSNDLHQVRNKNPEKKVEKS